MVVIVMGVSGVGKTTIGRELAGALGWRFVDADGFHSPVNLQKMAQGVPLTDEDREPWLVSVRTAIEEALQRDEDLVLACSALRHAYRERLTVDAPRQRWVYLDAPPELIARRLQSRAGHFMPVSLLASQLSALERPARALTVDATPSSDVVVASIRAGLRL
ncbi:gluconokinase [Myxococcaceae bacterium GXIMD 01537]